MFYVNDEPESRFLYTETIKLYCIVLYRREDVKMKEGTGAGIQRLNRAKRERSCWELDQLESV